MLSLPAPVRRHLALYTLGLVIATVFPVRSPADDLVRVFLDSEGDTLKAVLATGYRTVLHRANRFIDVVLPSRIDLSGFRQRFRCRLVQRAMNEYVHSLGRRPDWGAYHTQKELEETFERWKMSNPSIVDIETIGYGWDGNRGLAHRPISMAVMGRPAPGKPGLLLVGGVHAREIATVDTVLGIGSTLLAARRSDPATRRMMDNCVVYLVPCLNPDGRQRVFDGNIWWRKNCRPGRDGKISGVDLNRNFGFHFGADTPVGGSSSDPSSETYRGPYPFSEPEARALRSVVEEHPDIVASISFHGYGGFLLVPFGYNGRWPAEHELLYRRIAAMISAETDWDIGTVRELLGYFSNGRHDDWLYGARNARKDRLLAFQAEIGETFFPWADDLPGLVSRSAEVARRLLSVLVAEPDIRLGREGTVERNGLADLVVEVENDRLSAMAGLSIAIRTASGREYPVCEHETLAGRLRGHGPRRLRRLVSLPARDTFGRAAVLLRWTGGSRVAVFDLGHAAAVHPAVED